MVRKEKTTAHTKMLFLYGTSQSGLDVDRSFMPAYIGMWMSLTKYPMNPITANPMATALHSSMYSVNASQLNIPSLQSLRNKL